MFIRCSFRLHCGNLVCGAALRTDCFTSVILLTGCGCSGAVAVAINDIRSGRFSLSSETLTCDYLPFCSESVQIQNLLSLEAYVFLVFYERAPIGNLACLGKRNFSIDGFFAKRPHKYITRRESACSTSINDVKSSQ